MYESITNITFIWWFKNCWNIGNCNPIGFRQWVVHDSLRKAISIGGDTDTIACMVGGISEGYYGIPKILRNKALALLPEELRDILIRAYKFKKERSKIEVLERE